MKIESFGRKIGGDGGWEEAMTSERRRWAGTVKDELEKRLWQLDKRV